MTIAFPPPHSMAESTRRAPDPPVWRAPPRKRTRQRLVSRRCAYKGSPEAKRPAARARKGRKAAARAYRLRKHARIAGAR
jgi:hypothetical protein